MKVGKKLEMVPNRSSGFVDFRPCVVEHNPEYNEWIKKIILQVSFGTRIEHSQGQLNN